MWRTGETRLDRTAPGREFIKLPDEQIGLAYVFRVFPRISYALILRGPSAVQVGDRASTPSDSLDLTLPTPSQTEADRVLRAPVQPAKPQ
jgi:hypothetical protein